MVSKSVAIYKRHKISRSPIDFSGEVGIIHIITRIVWGWLLIDSMEGVKQTTTIHNPQI